MSTRTQTVLAGLAGLLIGALAMALAMPFGRTFGWGADALPQSVPMQGHMGMPGAMGGRGMGMNGGMGMMQNEAMGPEQSLIGVAATSLGMNRQSLVAELQGGKTIAQIAETRGIITDTIVNAFVTTREERLAQAVGTGMLSQTDADGRLAMARAMATSRLTQPWSPQQGQGMGLHQGQGMAQGRGQGQGQGQGRGQGQGQGQGRGQGQGQGQGQGRGQGTCNGSGFVDTNGDGVCDNAP